MSTRACPRRTREVGVRTVVVLIRCASRSLGRCVVRAGILSLRSRTVGRWSGPPHRVAFATVQRLDVEAGSLASREWHGQAGWW